MTLNRLIESVNSHLEASLDIYGSTRVREAMAYSLLDGGKRLRPVLSLALLEDLSGSYDNGLNAACALECIHTYSLIHDDLPALDNDDIRRFKPTNHIAFGEAIAILAGDGLLTHAFGLAAKSDFGGEACSILAQEAGVQRMILGQEIDIINSILSLDTLIECYKLKTGGLFSAAFQLGALEAKRPDLLPVFKEFGYDLGIAFQIQDDLLEVTQTEATIGKSTHSDFDREKITILDFVSLDDALKDLDTRFESMYALLEAHGIGNGTVSTILKTIDKRSV